ncbi:NAD-dependent epimerase/dehydratase family protein [Chloroflexota bacterium]
MAKKKKRIFLTGAGGKMGGAALKELLRPERKANHELVLLDLPTADNIKRLKPYADTPGLEIVWGDLTNYEDVLKCVSGADVVLHGAALISPAADHNPALAWKVNVGSVENIVRAIQAQPDPDAVRLVTVGTVAATGDRLPPIHVGRTGDPLKPSIFDMYACTKIAAERIVAESGLRHWVSLRQTFITSPDVQIGPIMFHQPLNTCFEICTAYNAGLVFANAAEDDIPVEFWRRFYNIGGGPNSRTTYLTFLKRSLALSGIQDITTVFDRNWFALQNFHCQWYEDSHILNDYLHHQVEGLEDALRHTANAMSWREKLGAKLSPPSLMKTRYFEPMAKNYIDSPLYWIEHDDEARINAFYGSRAAFENIPAWGIDMPAEPTGAHYKRLDHGYNEEKPSAAFDLTDMQGAAAFRGGKCLAKQMETGDLYTPLQWQCAVDHVFAATPNLILKGGHWCPECLAPDWNDAQEAQRNPFFAQVC